MTAARDAMTAGLGAAGVTTLDDAGVGDYIEGMLADAEDETDEDLAASIGPLLVDTGVAADDDAAQLLSMEIMRALRGAGGGPAADKTAIRTLNGPVSMMALVNADEHGAGRNVRGSQSKMPGPNAALRTGVCLARFRACVARAAGGEALIYPPHARPLARRRVRRCSVQSR